jgi:glyoxylase-like metal-dependent hydrolase (beta-lactamase superfamily II)
LFHPLKKTSQLKKHAALFEEHGGIKLQVLTHDAEASASCEWVHQRYGAGLYFHAADTPHLKRKTRCPIATVFSGRHQLDHGLEAIPLSGHTLGFTAYRLVAERVYLLIGDFLVPKIGAWTANVYKLLMPVGIANLNLLKTLDFDYLLPNKSKGPERPPFALAPAERQSAIDAAIAGLMKAR